MKPDIIKLAEAERILPFKPSTIRKNAARWGGFKFPGCREWVFSRSDLKRRLAEWQSSGGE